MAKKLSKQKTERLDKLEEESRQRINTIVLAPPRGLWVVKCDSNRPGYNPVYLAREQPGWPEGHRAYTDKLQYARPFNTKDGAQAECRNEHEQAVNIEAEIYREGGN